MVHAKSGQRTRVTILLQVSPPISFKILTLGGRRKLIAIIATLTDEFLDFSASRGNDLRSIGLKSGQKWCLCAPRWKEALDYAKSQSDGKAEGFSHHVGSSSSSIVPKVHLHATNAKALDVVDLKDLKMYAAETEAANASNVAQSRKGGMGGAIKETTELANKGEMTSREPKNGEHMS